MGESDFHGYHIIRSKCPEFNRESQGIQRNRKIGPIQRENKMTETVPKIDLTAGTLDTGFKTTVLTKVDIQKVENNV